jgi:hypothetical protein
VVATNSIGSSAPSDPQCATTLAPPPPPGESLLLTHLALSTGTVTAEWNQLADRYIVVASPVPDSMSHNGLTVASGTTPTNAATFSYDGSIGFFRVAADIAAVSNITSAGLVAAVKEQAYADAPTNRVYDMETEAILGLGLPGQSVAADELSSFGNLKALSLAGSGLTSLGSLTSLSNLVWLNLSSNQFASATLPGLPPGVEALDLENNQLSSLAMIEPLVHLRWLDLEGNKVTDLSSLVTNAANGGLGEGDQLWVRGNPLSAAATNQIQILQSTYKVKVIYQ